MIGNNYCFYYQAVSILSKQREDKRTLINISIAENSQIKTD